MNGNLLASYRGETYEDDRTIRDVIRKGREKWRRLDAWPWVRVDKYEAEWWRRDDVVEAWRAWSPFRFGPSRA